MTQQAIERYVAQFRAFAGNGAGSAPAWLRELREGAITRFAELGFPSARDEAWRFTSVAPITEREFILPAPVAPLPPVSALAPFLVEGPRVVFVNGRYAPTLSSAAGLPAGVVLGSLAAALESHGEIVRRHLAHHAQSDAHGFAALNTAFLKDGAFIHVAPGVVLAQPLQVLFLTVAAGETPALHPRTLAVVGQSAEVRLVESYVSLDGGSYLTNAVTEFVLENNARVEHCRIQRESGSGFHVAVSQSAQGRDSRFATTSVALGAALSRHNLGAVLQGTGGYLLLDGLSVLSAAQHADHHTTIDHAQPHCESHEFFNGVFDEQSRGVFTGRIIVRPGAQRTDSKQTNNNLLLSRDARADSQPQLEIYADDVKCTHGSTVGPLDETALFYLRSRGIGQDAARGLLTYGFAAEILDRIEIPGVRAMLDQLLRERLRVAEGEDRAA